MESTFQSMYNQRMSQVGGQSPVSIRSQVDISAGNVNVTATYRLVDSVTLTNLRATILVYEDSVYYNGGDGGPWWMGVTRKINDTSITLAHQGDQAVVTAAIPYGTWNPNQLHVVSYLQRTDTKEMIQGQLDASDYTVDYPLPHRRSVPLGNGTATFTATLTNISGATDTYTLQPGAPLGSWPVDYQVCGDNTWHTGAMQLSLADNQSCTFNVRVTTDGTKAERTGSFLVKSNTSRRTQVVPMQVFNGSFAVLVVEDDGTGSASVPIVDGLNGLGYLFDAWDVSTIGTFPSAADETGYDILIWETGTYHTTMGANEMANLMSFIDGGGALFFTSQYFLNTLGGQPNTFVTSYLGVASWSLDKGYDHLTGVAGDVIGDGLNLPEHFQYPSFKKGDDAVPGPTAATDLLANDGSHAMIRNTMGNGRKVVFEAEDFSAISETDPPPNNTQTVLQRILSWLQPPLAAVPDGPALGVTRIDAIRPNPAQQNAQISFVLSAAAATAPVKLEIFDLTGRRVAPVFEGHLQAGIQARTWDGRTASGAPVESGIYFARLTTAEGVRSAKLTLIR